MNKNTNLKTRKIALVTGGANGIGAAISQALLAEKVQVVIADRDPSGETFAKKIGASFFSINLANATECQSMVDIIAKQHGSIDILVNNAGFQHVCPLPEFPEETWNNMMEVMLNAPFRLSKYVWPFMQKKGWGRIINMASIHSQVASINKSAYVTAKHGLIGLTKTAALEGGEHGITVNAISPAYVRSALVENQITAQAKANSISEDDVLEKVLFKNSAIKRLIEPEEIADIVVMLCSDGAQSITGSNITIDGGWTAQ